MHEPCDQGLRLFGVPDGPSDKVRCGACDLRCRLAIDLEEQGKRVADVVARVAEAVAQAAAAAAAAAAPVGAHADDAAVGLATVSLALAPVLQRWVALRVLWAAATTLDGAGARICSAFVHLPSRNAQPAAFLDSLPPLLVSMGPGGSVGGPTGVPMVIPTAPPLSLTAVLDKLQASVYEASNSGSAAAPADEVKPPLASVPHAPTRDKKRRASSQRALKDDQVDASPLAVTSALASLFTPGLRLFVAHLASVVGRALCFDGLQLPARTPILAVQLHLVVCGALRAALAHAAALACVVASLARPQSVGPLDPSLVTAAAVGLDASAASCEAELWAWLEAVMPAAPAPQKLAAAKTQRVVAPTAAEAVTEMPQLSSARGADKRRPRASAAMGDGHEPDDEPTTPALPHETLGAGAAAAILRLLSGPPAIATLPGHPRSGQARVARVRLVSASLHRAACAAIGSSADVTEPAVVGERDAKPRLHSEASEAAALAAAAEAKKASERQFIDGELDRRREGLSTNPNDFDWLLTALLRDSGVSLDVSRQLSLTARAVTSAWAAPANLSTVRVAGDSGSAAPVGAALLSLPACPADSTVDNAIMNLLFPEGARAIVGPHVIPTLGLVTLVPRGEGDMLPVTLQVGDVSRVRTALADLPAIAGTADACADGASGPTVAVSVDGGATELLESLRAYGRPTTGAEKDIVAAFRGDPMRCDGCRLGWNHLCAFADAECAVFSDGTVLTPELLDALQARAARNRLATLSAVGSATGVAGESIASGVLGGLMLHPEALGDAAPDATPSASRAHPVVALTLASLPDQLGARVAPEDMPAVSQSLSGLEAPHVRAAVLKVLTARGHSAITEALAGTGINERGAGEGEAPEAVGAGGLNPRAARDVAAVVARCLQLSVLPLDVGPIVADELSNAAAADVRQAPVLHAQKHQPNDESTLAATADTPDPVAMSLKGGRKAGRPLKRRREASAAEEGDGEEGGDAAAASAPSKGNHLANNTRRTIAAQRRSDELVRFAFTDSLVTSHALAVSAQGGSLVPALRASSLLSEGPIRESAPASGSAAAAVPQPPPAFPGLLDLPVPPPVWPATDLEVTRNALAAAAAAGIPLSVGAAGVPPLPDVAAAMPVTLRQVLRMGPGNGEGRRVDANSDA